jgi:uncharacterized CHY-type Zn-finger protein
LKFPCTYDFHQMRTALESAGYSETKKKKSRKPKAIKCKVCGTDMVRQDESNVVACPNCDNYIVFEEKVQ